MLHPFAKFRPNCQKIQDEKNQWCSGLNDPDVLAEFNEFELNYSSIWEIQDSFYLYFLKKKIESAMKNQNKIDRRISILINFRKDGKYENDFNENTLISYGTFGVVCKVQEKLSNTEFAIKMTPIKQDYDQQSIREIAIITKLNPDYVVKCKSIWIEDRYDLFEKHMKKCKSKSTLIDNHSIEKSYVLFIQMELCFLTLKDAIEKINNELKQKIFPRMTRVGYYIACELMIELFEGVNYLHKLVPAVIHRDLKPSNILISFGTNGRFVKIADFGLSTLHEEDDQSHTIGTGTKRYMAPEVETKRKYDTRSDIYSLGLILKYVFNFELK
jgi:serine/threonine protein kinase